MMPVEPYDEVTIICDEDDIIEYRIALERFLEADAFGNCPLFNVLSFQKMDEACGKVICFDLMMPGIVRILYPYYESGGFTVECRKEDRAEFIIQFLLATGGYRIADIDFADMRPVLDKSPEFYTHEFFLDENLKNSFRAWLETITGKHSENLDEALLFVTGQSIMQAVPELDAALEGFYGGNCLIPVVLCVSDHVPEDKIDISLLRG